MTPEIITIVTVGVALAGVILTSARGVRQGTMARPRASARLALETSGARAAIRPVTSIRSLRHD